MQTTSLAGNVGDLGAFLVLPFLVSLSKLFGALGASRRRGNKFALWMVCSGVLGYGLLLTQSLAESGASVTPVLEEVGIACTRLELVEALASHDVTSPARKLQDLACLVHRIAPGLRLM